MLKVEGTKEQHKERLRKLVERLQDLGVKATICKKPVTLLR
ncbi:hypothetical protein [Ferdinandcohnia sp. Marseille-Q9671]